MSKAAHSAAQIDFQTYPALISLCALYCPGQDLRVRVERVSLPAVVTHRDGAQAKNIGPEDFAAYGNGAVREIA